MLTQGELAILRCPTTGRPLSWAPPELVRSVLEKLGERATGRGQQLNYRQPPMETALMTVDGEFLYPVVRGIPKLLADEAIDLVALGIGP